MKKFILTLLVCASTAFIAACSSTPKTTSLLDETRIDYRVAQSNPNVMANAPMEMKEAGDALDKANKAAIDHDSDARIDNFAYLAKQKIATAQEISKQKVAEAEVANAAKERDQIRLDQRTKEADAANAKAQAAQSDAAIANSRAAQLEAELAELSAQKTERGIVITLGDVLFATDSAHLTSDGEAKAQKLATILQQNPQRTVLIEGYTDSTGTPDYNQDLSQRRADSVRAALLSMGISNDRIMTRGYGQTNPVASNATAADRQLNRRVEIVLSDMNGQIGQR